MELLRIRAVPRRCKQCKHLDDKALFAVVLRLYAGIHRELRNSTQIEDAESDTEFREQRRRKRNPSND
jgi:hypothetical protein